MTRPAGWQEWGTGDGYGVSPDGGTRALWVRPGAQGADPRGNSIQADYDLYKTSEYGTYDYSDMQFVVVSGYPGIIYEVTPSSGNGMGKIEALIAVEGTRVDVTMRNDNGITSDDRRVMDRFIQSLSFHDLGELESSAAGQ